MPDKIALYNVSDSDGEGGFWRKVADNLLTHGIQLVEYHRRNGGWLGDSRELRDLPSIPLPGALEMDAVVNERASQWGNSLSCDAISQYEWNFVQFLLLEQPRLVILWNGEHADQLLLRSLLERTGTNVVFAERTPWPFWISLDNMGILSNCSWATRSNNTKPTAQNTPTTYSRYKKYLDANRGATWWPQAIEPTNASDFILSLAKGRKILLFCGQVDEDTQNFLFSPYFEGTLDAWKWLLAHIGGNPEVFILGKHHPKSRTSMEAFNSACDGHNAIWTDDLTTEDCFKISSHVIAVNSSMLCEACINGLPALALGDTPINASGVTTTILSRNDTDGLTTFLSRSSPLAAEDQKRWDEFSNDLFENRLYCSNPSLSDDFERSTGRCSEMLASEARERGEPDFQQLIDYAPAIITELQKCKLELEDLRGKIGSLPGYKIALRLRTHLTKIFG